MGQIGFPARCPEPPHTYPQTPDCVSDPSPAPPCGPVLTSPTCLRTNRPGSGMEPLENATPSLHSHPDPPPVPAELLQLLFARDGAPPAGTESRAMVRTLKPRAAGDMAVPRT